MSKWKCEACGNTVQASKKPPHCPCGSEQIVKTHQGPLEWLMHKLHWNM